MVSILKLYFKASFITIFHHKDDQREEILEVLDAFLKSFTASSIKEIELYF